MYVVSDMLYDRTEAIIAAVLTAIVIGMGWFGIGLVRRVEDPEPESKDPTGR